MRPLDLQCVIPLLAAASLLFAAAAPAPSTPPNARLRAPAPSGPPEGITRVKLYDKTPNLVAGRDTDASPLEPTVDLYLLKDSPTPAPAIVILPGGGYTNLSMANEGSSIARMFNSKGLAAFVVRYRHAPLYHSPIPLEDAQRAMRFVRAHAAEYHIDPTKLGVIGFSAGGHNAAALATAADSARMDAAAPTGSGQADPIDNLSARPDFVILLYPVIDLTDPAVTHIGSRDALTNKDPSLYDALSPQKHVTRDTPPMFIAQGGDDKTVPIKNSLLIYEACKAAGVPAEIHIFEHGGHGFGLALNDPVLRVWPDLAAAWLARNKVIIAPPSPR